MSRIYFLIIIFGVCHCSHASACTEIDGIPDRNCDGSVVVSVVGDSLVTGYGDTEHKNRGGYIIRARKALPKIVIKNLGRSGLVSEQLLGILQRALQGKSEQQVRDALLISDIVVLDFGRNDRWIHVQPVDTFKTLVKSANLIRTRVKELTGIEPIVVTAAMMIPSRMNQGDWVREVNSHILKSSTLERPADLRFDLVPRNLVHKDKVHPTAKGYSSLAKTFVSYLSKSLPKKMRALNAEPDAIKIAPLTELVVRVKSTTPGTGS